MTLLLKSVIPQTARKRMGEILIDKGKITQEELDDALAEQEDTDEFLGDLLVNAKKITEVDLYEAIALQEGIDFIHIEEFSPDYDLVARYPRDLLERFKILPYQIGEDQEVLVVTHDPNAIHLLDILFSHTQLRHNLRIIPKSQLEKFLDETVINPKVNLEKIGIDKVLENVNLEFVRELEQENARQNLNEMTNASTQATIVTLVNKVILMGIKENASDIHIEPLENQVLIRFRKDGVLQIKMELSAQLQGPLTSRIMIMSNLDITERFLPQDGSFKIRYEDRPVEFRVALIPTIFGMYVVLRILNVKESLAKLENLGLLEPEVKILKKHARAPYGMILVSGPTGSGKSTTLYAVMNYLNTPHINIITIEDPVENRLRGIKQIQVHLNKTEPEKSLTFARGLRSVLRLDPDIIMVGEIRDQETADVAIRAALTGHLLLSTVHANNSIETIRRLQNIGVELYLMISSLNLVIAQRLIRVLCPHCKTPFVPTKEFLEENLFPVDFCSTNHFFDAPGCELCEGTGYAGRRGVYEFLELDESLKEKILSGSPLSLVRKMALEAGMKQLRQVSLEAAARGLTSLQEISRSIAVT